MPRLPKQSVCYTIITRLSLWLMLLVPAAAAAQDTASARRMVTAAEKYLQRFPTEKIYLQIDRSYYTPGDTLWFKTYVFSGAGYTPSEQSAKVYIEVLNDSNRVADKFAVPLKSGMGRGQIAIDSRFASGNYTLRAYTNWGLNFGTEAIFNKPFYVGKPSTQGSWLVNEQHTIKRTGNDNLIDMVLQLTALDKMAVPYRDVELRLTDGKRTLFKKALTTSDAGKASSRFTLPDKAETRALSISVTDKTTGNSYIFPFYAGGEMEKIDLQFMPEGGALVAGLPARVGYKAVGEDGLGLDVKGVITDATGKTVSDFKSDHLGMGVFPLYPQAGQTYCAKVAINGSTKTTPLPAVQPSGISLRVESNLHLDSVFVYIRATPDVAAAAKPYMLMAQSISGVYFAIPLSLQQGYKHLRLGKSGFASGIVSFTLLDGYTPINQRRVFIDHQDRLKIEAAGTAERYTPSDSIAVALNVRDQDGKPIHGSFSVAVTNDTYSRDPDPADNMVSRLLLTSELKGYLEQPAWYFTGGDQQHKQKALDNLLLTQGWAGFNWQSLAQPMPAPKYFAETGNRLTGKLTNLFGKPARPAKLSLFTVSKKYGLLLFDTVTNDKGLFAFDSLPLLDTISYTLRVMDKKGQLSAATITLDEAGTAPLPNNAVRSMPWFARASDSLMIGYFNRPGQRAASPVDPRDVKGKLLNEVTIKATKRATVDGRDYGMVKKEIDEKKLILAGKRTLRDLLRQQIPTFGMAYIWQNDVFSKATLHDYPGYTLGMAYVADVFIDGNSVQQMYNAEATGDIKSYSDFLQGFLASVTADDVKNIRIASSFVTTLHITTRSGQGLFVRSSPGLLPYRPLAMCMPAEFYRPRYNVANANVIRPTIHWQPNVVTDNDGKAAISFFAAGKPGTYTVIIEGTDMAGNFGYQTTKLTIGREAVSATKPNPSK